MVSRRSVDKGELNMMRKMMITGMLLAALATLVTPLNAENEKPVEELTVRGIGGNKENGDIVVSPYPSDHSAVVATIKLAK